MAEAYVCMIKRDYVHVSLRPDAQTVMHQLSRHSDIVHPVSSSKLTEARDRVRSFGGLQRHPTFVTRVKPCGSPDGGPQFNKRPSSSGSSDPPMWCRDRKYASQAIEGKARVLRSRRRASGYHRMLQPKSPGKLIDATATQSIDDRRGKAMPTGIA